MVFAPGILKDRVAIVTGGGTGIGRGIALGFARYGAHVVLASRKMENLERTASEVRSLGVKALPLATDVRVPEQVERMVQRTLEELGRVDVLVNAAAGNFRCDAQSLSPNGWRVVIDIDLNGTFLCCRAVFEPMRRQGGGKIISITSSHYVTRGGPGTSHAASAKAGIEALTKTLALEWGKYGILVNAIAPGWVDHTEGVKRLLVDTGLYEKAREENPLGRFAQIEDIANMAIYLASDAGNYITGATMVVDGGDWLKRAF